MLVTDLYSDRCMRLFPRRRSLPLTTLGIWKAYISRHIYHQKGMPYNAPIDSSSQCGKIGDMVVVIGTDGRHAAGKILVPDNTIWTTSRLHLITHSARLLLSVDLADTSCLSSE